MDRSFEKQQNACEVGHMKIGQDRQISYNYQTKLSTHGAKKQKNINIEMLAVRSSERQNRSRK